MPSATVDVDKILHERGGQRASGRTEQKHMEQLDGMREELRSSLVELKTALEDLKGIDHERDQDIDIAVRRINDYVKLLDGKDRVAKAEMQKELHGLLLGAAAVARTQGLPVAIDALNHLNYWNRVGVGDYGAGDEGPAQAREMGPLATADQRMADLSGRLARAVHLQDAESKDFDRLIGTLTDLKADVARMAKKMGQMHSDWEVMTKIGKVGFKKREDQVFSELAGIVSPATGVALEHYAKGLMIDRELAKVAIDAKDLSGSVSAAGPVIKLFETYKGNFGPMDAGAGTHGRRPVESRKAKMNSAVSEGWINDTEDYVKAAGAWATDAIKGLGTKNADLLKSFESHNMTKAQAFALYKELFAAWARQSGQDAVSKIAERMEGAATVEEAGWIHNEALWNHLRISADLAYWRGMGLSETAIGMLMENHPAEDHFKINKRYWMEIDKATRKAFLTANARESVRVGPPTQVPEDFVGKDGSPAPGTFTGNTNKVPPPEGPDSIMFG